MSRAGDLYRLQEIDLALDMRRARLAEVEAALKDDSAAARAREALQRAEAALSQARDAAHLAEAEAQAVGQKMSGVEGTLYGGTVRNPKELLDLQAEAEYLSRRRRELEDRQLEAMVTVETAEAAVTVNQELLDDALVEQSRRIAALEQEKEQVAAGMERRGIEREAAEAQVRRDDRDIYDRLRKNRNGVAVARLVEGNCGACGVAPSAQRIAVALAGEGLVQCGNCERILYVDRAARFSEAE